jgi:hypothetical protein
LVSLHYLGYCLLILTWLKTILVRADGIYQRFEQGSEVEKVTLARPELEDFIYNTIVKTLGPLKAVKLNKTVDLFAFGVDSLQGTRIRNALQQALELNGKTLGQNGALLYEVICNWTNLMVPLQSCTSTPRLRSISLVWISLL